MIEPADRRQPSRSPPTPPCSRPGPSCFDVGILFFNRASQTIDCVRSFLRETIRPNIIILDQGSDARERSQLECALSNLDNFKMMRSATNLGVATGRNRLAREAGGDWILFVDNDITLNTVDGVSILDRLLRSSAVEGYDGVVPKLFNAHDQAAANILMLSDKDGRIAVQTLPRGCNSTNILPGGASLFRRDFMLAHPFDERFFVGFEDFDAALSAYRKGRPIRGLVFDGVELVHRHIPAVTESGVRTVDTRYDVDRISTSWNVFRQKHRDENFGNWERWVAQQRLEMKGDPSVVPKYVSQSTKRRPRIVFVLDVEGWAFENIYKQVKPNLEFDLHCVYSYKYESLGILLYDVLYGVLSGRYFCTSCGDVTF